jgi:hypothetical protein
VKNLYNSKKFTKSIEIYQENGFVHYKELTPFGKKVYQIPLDRFGASISFSRAYHAPFFLVPVFLAFLAIRVILKKWDTGGRVFYMELTIMCFICIGMIYYLIVGKNYGEVELDFGDFKLPLYMKNKEFIEFQERLADINQST